MKKFLALTLLVCASAQAVDWAKIGMVAGMGVCGEVLYHVNQDRSTRSCSGSDCKSSTTTDLFKDAVTVAGGTAALTVIDQKIPTITDVVENSFISLGSFKLSTNESFKNLLKSIPGARGIFVGSEKQENEVQSIARSGLALMICKSAYEFAKSTITGLISSTPKTLTK